MSELLDLILAAMFGAACMTWVLMPARMVDPNSCKVRARQRIHWAIFHDLVAHPLLVIGGYCTPVRWLHDTTSRLAWPRKK